MTDGETIMKQAAKALDVPVGDVPNVIKNLLNEIGAINATITQLK